jgi:HlyD family secretion protein
MVMRTIEAEGIVQPESEVLLLNPTTTTIRKILKAPGSRVAANEIILFLDPAPLQEEIAKLEDQIDIKRNNLQRTKLTARSTRVDLDYQVEMKNLRIVSLKSDLADQEELLEVGGISPAKFEKTRQELTLAEKDLEMIEARNSIRLQQLEVEEEGLELQIRVQEKELESWRNLLGKTTVKAPSAGIILAINGSEGEIVSKDKLLVRMSDLSSFKIIGSVNEELAESIKTGNTVFALLDNEKLSGQIGTVYPEIQGSKIRFDVYLEKSNHPNLLANRSVKLQVVNRKKEDVLRLKNGPGIGKGRQIELYQVKQGLLIRKTVELGMRGMDYVEIRAGLEPGDRVIISETDEFRNRPEVEISQ